MVRACYHGQAIDPSYCHVKISLFPNDSFHYMKPLLASGLRSTINGVAGGIASSANSRSTGFASITSNTADDLCELSDDVVEISLGQAAKKTLKIKLLLSHLAGTKGASNTVDSTAGGLANITDGLANVTQRTFQNATEVALAQAGKKGLKIQLLLGRVTGTKGTSNAVDSTAGGLANITDGLANVTQRTVQNATEVALAQAGKKGLKIQLLLGCLTNAKLTGDAVNETAGSLANVTDSVADSASHVSNSLAEVAAAALAEQAAKSAGEAVGEAPDSATNTVE